MAWGLYIYLYPALLQRRLEWFTRICKIPQIAPVKQKSGNQVLLEDRLPISSRSLTVPAFPAFAFDPANPCGRIQPRDIMWTNNCYQDARSSPGQNWTAGVSPSRCPIVGVLMSKPKVHSQEGIPCRHPSWGLAGIFIAIFKGILVSGFSTMNAYWSCKDDLFFIFFLQGRKGRQRKAGTGSQKRG